MAIMIKRFEPKEVKPNVNGTNVRIENNTTMLIKDHSNDKIIGFIQLENDVKKNKELAERIIVTIEDWIEENEA